MSGRGVALRVEVPGDQENASHPSDEGRNGEPESSRWSRYLQSPTQVFGQAMEKTFKLTNKKNGPAPSERSRTSVDPYRRAAMDAQYRTDLSLQHESTPVTTPAASGFGGWLGGKAKGSGDKEQEFREIHFNPSAGPVPTPIPETNRVVTSKYNIITFVPIFLFEMFSRVAYLYFLIQASLSWWSVVSPYSGVGATAALVFVLLVAAVKAIWEDSKRHQEDQRMNKSIAHRLKEDGSVEDIQWTDVQVGDALVVRDDENFPADLLCLWSSLDDNVCFIRTTNLDGETNLKIRKPLDFKGMTINSKEEILNLDLTLKAEPPNKNLHKFKGSAIVRSRALASSVSQASAEDENGVASVEVAVTMNEMLLRGCTLKNSKEIVGLVVYTGKHSRIQMNATKTPLKVGK